MEKKVPDEIPEPDAKAVLDTLLAEGWQVKWQTSPSRLANCPVCDTTNRDGDIELADSPPIWMATCGNGHMFQYRKLKLVRSCRVVADRQ